MSRQAPRTEELEQAVAAYSKAVEKRDMATRVSIVNGVLEQHGPLPAADALLSLAARYRAESLARQAALVQKNELLESLLAEPRRMDQVIGLLHEAPPEGDPVTWAVLQGPPPQAVRFDPAVDPSEICPDDDPDPPVWVWLIATEGSLVVAGRIDPPEALKRGPEREMVFHSFVHEGEESDDA